MRTSGETKVEEEIKIRHAIRQGRCICMEAEIAAEMRGD